MPRPAWRERQTGSHTEINGSLACREHRKGEADDHHVGRGGWPGDTPHAISRMGGLRRSSIRRRLIRLTLASRKPREQTNRPPTGLGIPSVDMFVITAFLLREYMTVHGYFTNYPSWLLGIGCLAHTTKSGQIFSSALLHKLRTVRAHATRILRLQAVN